MYAWLAANAATIIVSAVLVVIVGLIVRGMIRGRVKACGCSSCGACGQSAACSACRQRPKRHGN